MFSIAQIHNGIFEHLRLVLVANGYLPDILVDNTPNAYNNALQAIKASGKKPCYLYGVGGWNAREELKLPTIVIDFVSRQNSELGYNGQIKYIRNGNTNTFTEQKEDYECANLNYKITLVCADIQTQNVYQMLIHKAYSNAVTLKGFDNENYTQGSFQLYRNDIINNADEQMIELVYTYTAKNILLAEDTVLNENVPSIIQTEITTQTNI
jgi:hypothetical protein